MTWILTSVKARRDFFRSPWHSARSQLKVAAISPALEFHFLRGASPDEPTRHAPHRKRRRSGAERLAAAPARRQSKEKTQTARLHALGRLRAQRGQVER